MRKRKDKIKESEVDRRGDTIKIQAKWPDRVPEENILFEGNYNKTIRAHRNRR